MIRRSCSKIRLDLLNNKYTKHNKLHNENIVRSLGPRPRYSWNKKRRKLGKECTIFEGFLGIENDHPVNRTKHIIAPLLIGCNPMSLFRGCSSIIFLHHNHQQMLMGDSHVSCMRRNHHSFLSGSLRWIKLKLIFECL